MKWIKYKVVQDTSGEEVICLIKKIGYNEANLAIAQAEAYNGEYTIEEDATTFEQNPLGVNFGGTGAKTAEQARKNLGAVAMKTATVSLPASAWSNNRQTISITGVTESNTVIVTAAPASYEHYNECAVRCSAQSADKLTFTYTYKPTDVLAVNVLILG